MKTKNFMLLIIFGISFQLTAKEEKTSYPAKSGPVLDVYINCISCDFQYLKENMSYLNFSREPATADVQIIVTSLPTGSGGEEYLMEFAGRQRFATIHDTLKFTVEPDLTQHEMRNILLGKLQTGLFPFLVKTSFAKNLLVIVNDPDEDFENKTIDKWRNWVFSTDFSGFANQEKTLTNFSVNAAVFASKITPKLKLELGAGYDLSETVYRFWDQDSIVGNFNSRVADFRYDGILVKTTGDHSGVGCKVSQRSSSFYNLKNQLIVAPAFEYSVFKYSDASRRQLIFRYIIGYEHSDYFLATIEGKLHDRLFLQDLKIGFSVIEKFGQIDASIHGSDYLNDFSCYDLGADFYSSIKICRGVSINSNINVSYIRNQISLPGDNLTPEAQIIGTREMKTDFRFSCGFGISFSFGSKNNNTVNPRLDF